MSEAGDDRRGAPRAAYSAAATAYVGNERIDCQVVNLSKGGALLVGGTIRVGTFVRLNIKLPGVPQPIDLDAIVIRQDEVKGRAAFGIQFHQLPAHANEAIHRYVMGATGPLPIQRPRSAATTGPLPGQSRSRLGGALAPKEALKHVAHKRYDEAARVLREAIEREPDNEAAQIWLHVIAARRFKEAGDTKNALQSYREVLALDGQHGEALRETKAMGGILSRIFKK